MKTRLVWGLLILGFCAAGCSAAQMALDVLGVELSVDSSALHFKATVGGAKPDVQNIRVSCISHDSDVGNSDCDFNVSVDKNWLSVTPTSSTGSDRLIVTVDPSNLETGTYTATIHVESDAFMQVDESQDVAVDLIVSP